MATEASREMSIRRICENPDEDGPFVSLKVIDKISFIDAKSQYQEFEFSFDNTPTSSRVTHIDEIDGLKVERIDKLGVIDSKDRHQETLLSFLRYQQGVHLQTHKTKIYALNADKTKDESTWIEVERIDKIFFVDPKENYQEFVYELKWSDNPEWDYSDLTPVVTQYDGTTINPPWRIDPFQNIVDASFSSWDFAVIDYHWGSDADLDIRHTILKPFSGILGWSELDAIGDFCFWGGDNTGQFPYAESVYFDLKKMKKYKLSLEMELRALWYRPRNPSDENANVSPVTVRITLSKGGYIFKNATLWTPANYSRLKTETIIVADINDYQDFYLGDSSTWQGQLIATLTLSQHSGEWKLT